MDEDLPLAILRQGLDAFASRSLQSGPMSQVRLPRCAIAKVKEYKASLDLTQFKHHYGHSLEIVTKVWEDLEHKYHNSSIDIRCEEFLCVLHFYTNFPAIDKLLCPVRDFSHHLPNIYSNTRLLAFSQVNFSHKSNKLGRHIVAKATSIVTQMFGKEYMGIKVSPAIPSPNMMACWYYVHEDNLWTEHELTNIKFAENTRARYKLINSAIFVNYKITIYVLHHPSGLKIGPIEKPRGRGFAFTIRQTVMNALREHAGITHRPPPTEFTLIVAVTSIELS